MPVQKKSGNLLKAVVNVAYEVSLNLGTNKKVVKKMSSDKKKDELTTSLPLREV